jgi:hypothetical protein
MKVSTFLLVLLLLFQVSCKKDETPDNSGTVTIDNTKTLGQTYYVYGFLFSEARKVTTQENPGPDVTVESDGTNLFFQTDNFKDSFFRFGEYNDAAAAQSAFNSLTSATVGADDWEGLALPVLANQVWIYRSGSEHYAKIRIISIISEVRAGLPFAECTFEWAYQPDGTLTFPGK